MDHSKKWIPQSTFSWNIWTPLKYLSPLQNLLLHHLYAFKRGPEISAEIFDPRPNPSPYNHILIGVLPLNCGCNTHTYQDTRYRLVSIKLDTSYVTLSLRSLDLKSSTTNYVYRIILFSALNELKTCHSNIHCTQFLYKIYYYIHT